MAKLIECIPNFSEGRREDVIAAILAAVRQVSGIRVLDLTSDRDHNRSVLTLVGDETNLPSAIDALFRTAISAIDLTVHQGEHPRAGAVDVVPFVPLAGATMADAVALARRVGEEIAAAHGVPVYLYEDAASSEARRNLADIRKGEFEGFAEKIKRPEWVPDFGAPRIHPTAGITVVGARMALIAFNVNLGTDRLDIANTIARSIRHIGGGLRYVKAMGVALEDRRQVQISMNLTNYKKTPVFRVFEMIQSEAARYGVSVVGSEIVGLVPSEALFEVAGFYLRLENYKPEIVLENKLGGSE